MMFHMYVKIKMKDPSIPVFIIFYMYVKILIRDSRISVIIMFLYVWKIKFTKHTYTYIFTCMMSPVIISFPPTSCMPLKNIFHSILLSLSTKPSFMLNNVDQLCLYFTIMSNTNEPIIPITNYYVSYVYKNQNEKSKYTCNYYISYVCKNPN